MTIKDLFEHLDVHALTVVFFGENSSWQTMKTWGRGIKYFKLSVIVSFFANMRPKTRLIKSACLQAFLSTVCFVRTFLEEKISVSKQLTIPLEVIFKRIICCLLIKTQDTQCSHAPADISWCSLKKEIIQRKYRSNKYLNFRNTGKLHDWNLFKKAFLEQFCDWVYTFITRLTLISLICTFLRIHH